MATRILVVLLFLSAAFAQTEEEYSRQASDFIKTQEPQRAVALLIEAVRAYPDSPELLFQLGRLFLSLGRAAEAETLFDRVLGFRPYDSEVLRYKAEARLQMGNVKGARRLFRRLLDLDPKEAGAHYRLSGLELTEGQSAEALEHGRKAVDLDPSNSQYRRRLAFLLDLENRREEAFQQLKIALRLAPRDAALLLSMAERRKQDGNLSGAMEFAEMAVEVDGENPLHHRQLSEIYDQMGRLDEALRHANLARRLESAFGDYVRATQMASKGRSKEALDFLEDALAEVPQFVTGLLYLADLHQQVGSKKRALEIYSQILVRDPMHQSALEQSVWLHLQGGHAAAARELFSSLDEQGSPNRDLFEGYGRLLDGDGEGALEHFRRMEERQPLNGALLRLISYTLTSIGRREEALGYLDQAARFQPDDQEIPKERRQIHLDSGLELMDQHRWRRALEVFEAIILKGDAEAEVYFRAAYCRQRLGFLKEAVEDYRRGLRLDPHSEWARLNLASALYSTTRYKEAVEEWEWLAARHPSQDVFFQLGMCYSHLERLAEAESAFSRSMKMGLETADLYYNLGLTRFRLGRQFEGLQLIRLASRHGYDPAVQFLRRVKEYK